MGNEVSARTPQTGDVILATLLYYQRDLGRYCQHPASSLKNVGSRLATAAGLAHTATSDYVKDTGMVDIGLHYVATFNGLPIDTDGDGLADYVEDANGNCVVDAGETDWTNPDTDGDGLSDGTEVDATSTNPLNPNDASNHDLQSVIYSISHPTLISRVTSEEPTTQTFLVKRGTDALRLSIHMVTTETPPENYADYNDRLTYRIQSPLLPAIQGSFQLPQLGSQTAATILPPEWFVCHSKTLEADSYVTVTLTAENVNGGNRHSSISVAISALRVDFDPILGPAGDDRLVFGTESPQGKLQVNLRAKIQPTDQAALDYLTGRVRFEAEAIGDSNLQWGAGNGLGIYDGSGQFTNSATFHGLPTSNGAFGPKIAKLFVDNRWGFDSEQQIRVFYPADAFNHPGPQPPPGEGLRPPNYFYYYMQTEAGAPTKTADGPFWDGGGSRFVPTPPFKYFVEAATERSGKLIPVPGVNGDQTLMYIDLFAWACRNELKHHTDSVGWFGGASPPFKLIDNPPGTGDDRDAGSWGDLLPDSLEHVLPAAGGQYDPTKLDSHPDDDYQWSSIDPRPDSQRHTCITAQEWTHTGSSAGWDWAAPGKNYPN